MPVTFSGPCSFCESADVIVEVNGFRACLDHIDNAFAGGLMAAQALREQLANPD